MKRILLAVFAALVAAPLLAAFPTPVAHWSGKITDGKVADLSGNGVTLTPGEGVTVVDDTEMGEVLAFSGLSNGWAQASVRFPHINARTIAMWIRREATIPLSGNAYPHIFGALCGLNCSWYQTENVVRFALAGPTAGSDDNIYSKIQMSFPAEEWHFMVWTLNPTGTANQYEVAGYLDGVQVGTTQTLTFTKSIDYSDPETRTDYVVLGNNAKANNRGFYGQVKDVRIYGVALTQNQQTKLWLDAKALLPKKMIGYWPLETITGEEGAGKARSTPDLSGNGHDFTCGGTDIAVVKGIQGNCFSLTAPYNGSDGNVGYGGLTFQLNRVIGPYTLSLWVKRDQFEEVKNGPRLFADWANPTLQLQCDSLTGKRLNVSWDGKNHYSTTDAVRRAGEWSFATIVFNTAYDAETDTYSGKHAFYMDGEPVSYSADEAFSAPRFPLKKNSRFIFGSNAVPPAQGTRNFPGCIDEIRMTEGALTADEVKALYRGAAKVDAGADFAVTGEKAVLRGEVASRGVDFGMQTGYAGAVRWNLVSAPDGGEDVVFARQENPVCEVTLPVAGVYVFRLSTVAGFLSQADEVMVTRESSASEQPPTVTGATANPSAVTYSGVSALSATVSTGARVVWSKVSGPGAVLFQPANAAKTVAAFTATGDYVLRCTAETDAGTAFQDVSVTVSAAFAAGGVTTGLLAAWTFDDTIAESISGKSGLIYSNATDVTTLKRYVPGAVGTYLYSAPIAVSKTTVVRAAVCDAESILQLDTSATYLFLADIFQQNAEPPEGFPVSEEVNGQVMRYGMRPDIVNGDAETRARLCAGFTNGIRTVSFVIDPLHLFDKKTGIYVNATSSGDDWERPMMVEQIYPSDPEDEFSVPCGVRIRGAFSRRPEYPKHGFHLIFRSGYGMSKLNHPLFGSEGADSFDRIDFRCDRRVKRIGRERAVRPRHPRLAHVGEHGTVRRHPDRRHPEVCAARIHHDDGRGIARR